MKRQKIRVNGYVMVYCPDHPKAHKGYVYEHVLVAEKMLGRYLQDDEQVHHLNFNRLDNRKKNILVLSKAMHTKLHNWIDRVEWLQECIESENDGEYYVEQCLTCGEYISDIANQSFCDMDCQREYLEKKKAKRPTREELEALLDENYNKVQIGQMYGVHRTTINNWLRDYSMM